MASKYEISPLSSNKTIVMILKDIEKHLKNNPLYKVYFSNVAYTSGTQVFNKSDIEVQDGDVLTSGDIVFYNNSYYAVIDAIGESTYTIVNAISFRGQQGIQGIQGQKGDKGDTGDTGATGNGIASITKTSSSGLDDTYTITYTDGTTSTIVVTNGNGIVSIAKTSTSGLVDTYTITFDNGNTTNFNVTNGADGETGNGIASVTKTSTSGNVDTYTITFTNGTTTTFDVTNGNISSTGTLTTGSSIRSALSSYFNDSSTLIKGSLQLKYLATSGVTKYITDYVTSRNPYSYNIHKSNRELTADLTIKIDILSIDKNGNFYGIVNGSNSVFNDVIGTNNTFLFAKCYGKFMTTINTLCIASLRFEIESVEDLSYSSITYGNNAKLSITRGNSTQTGMIYDNDVEYEFSMIKY